MTRHFVSAGWPYLYDIPGLHNCVPMLFADVCARYYRTKGEEVFFLSGADEHGARTEYVAQGYGTTPQKLLDEKYQATLPLLDQLELSFDAFERTTDRFHKKFVQDFFAELRTKEALIESTQKVAWCSQCNHHLPDRFLEGTCPHCEGKTYGNQCNNKKVCSRLVESHEIKDPRCAVCATTVSWKEEPHFFFQMQPFADRLQDCATAPERDWEEVKRRVEHTLVENPTVCVTRDTRWGIEVPGLVNKSVYSWVDSLLAKVSMLAKISPEKEAQYWKSSEAQHHFFLGMDGTPFYGALLPGLLLASERGYVVDHWSIMPNEVFIYEGGICSKSTGTGIWLQEALAVLPGDYWRFYIFFIHASVESGAERDVDFRWDRFCGSINTWLLQGLSDVIVKGTPGLELDGIEEEKQVGIYMEAGKFGQAFLLILETLVKCPTVAKTKRLAPWFSCFLPEAGKALMEGKIPFEAAPLYFREVQMDYQDMVDARRSQRGLGEEITDARADMLCVCPINLTEQ